MAKEKKVNKVNKELKYTIKAILWFDPESPDVEEYIDRLREIGEVEIENVELVVKE